MSHDTLGASAPKNHHIGSFVHLFGEQPEDILGCLREGEEQLDGILEFLDVIKLFIDTNKDPHCAISSIKNLIRQAGDNLAGDCRGDGQRPCQRYQADSPVSL